MPSVRLLRPGCFGRLGRFGSATRHAHDHPVGHAHVEPGYLAADQPVLPVKPGKRDQRAGIAEAVKVSLIKDAKFFNWLHESRHLLAEFDEQAVAYMIRRCAELHLHHIATSGDPFEYGSARPLDFGHWSAHRLEELSGHDLRHGEAVAIGIALDSLYSTNMGLITPALLEKIVATLRDLGFSLSHSALTQLDIHKALQDFREHLGGELCITLLTGEGQAAQFNHIDVDVMQRSVNHLVAHH